jgi:hypothetical protein
LVPKKAKDFKKPTAEDLGLPENLVNDVIDFYWAKVRKHISALDYDNISIPNLGVFKVKHWKIDETVEKYKLHISRMEGKFTEHIVKRDLEERIAKLHLVKKSVEETELKFKAIRDARNNKNNMEEQSPDMGGLSKQSDQEGTCREDS